MSELRDEEELLETVNGVLKSVGDNLSAFVEDCSKKTSLADPDPGGYEAELESQIFQVREDAASLLRPPVDRRNEGVEKLEEAERRYDRLYEQWEDRENRLGRAREEIIRLKNQVMHQSTFCAGLGAVLGNLVWQASRSPPVIDAWISRFQTKVGDFLRIVNGTFGSFVNTYGSVFPSEISDESQFVMGLCGTVANLSANPEGRQFLVTHPNGRDLLRKLIEFMPIIPLPTGNSLAKLTLMILYNVSINQTGLLRLMEDRICRGLERYMEHPATVELKQLSLRLLQSVTFELEDVPTIEDIAGTVLLERIAKIGQTESENLAAVAKEILSNLEKSKSSLERSYRQRYG
ncbi:heat shock factor 2-binding protein-like isoform X2 [Athalia rosae]|uniref:heat shock factor 2-binding protein-like isoform X2 n=1 Tax=Athalia rosae TaxID=37344 RepID=UPI0020344DC7|nr:heat shock factor 2-binding protein-like isoform X2 [Athalia rosae]